MAGLNDTEFAELWLDTHAEGGNMETLVSNYRKAVPECIAQDKSLHSALSNRATKIRAGFVEMGKTPDEALELFPKFRRNTKTVENLTSALERIQEIQAAAKAAAE